MNIAPREFVFRFDCPWCGTKAVSFTSLAWCNAGPARHTDWFGECGYCGRGVVVSVPPQVQAENAYDMYRRRDFALGKITIAPALPSTGAPPYTPDNVGCFFSQGMSNLAGQWDAAGTMFRKALDTALTAKFPDIEGRLVQRIEKAGKAGLLTADMAEWAHEIRRLGNDAAHEDEPFSAEDARALHAFTELVLRYLFTLPGMMAEARAGGDDGGGAGDPA